MKQQTAIQFFKLIENEKEKYKLINGLFIVKYISKKVAIYIGEFSKSGNALNSSKINKVFLSEMVNHRRQLFNIKEKKLTTSLGFWKKSNIKLIEKPIIDILK